MPNISNVEVRVVTTVAFTFIYLPNILPNSYLNMLLKSETENICPANRQEWRTWLQENHATKQSVWLVYYKKKANKPSLTYSEAVEEALCFGWIDSKAVPINEESYRQFFSKRKAGGTWSKVNKERIVQLTEKGLMAEPGLATIEAARENGSWIILDEVEQLIIPPDLELAFQTAPAAEAYFFNLCRSDKRNILQWLVLARRPETRQARITEIVQKASEGKKPKPFSR